MITAWRTRRNRRRWQHRERVLAALALAERRGAPDMAGWPLMQATGLSGPALYAALYSLEGNGLVTSRWSSLDIHPRRRYYRLATMKDAL